MIKYPELYTAKQFLSIVNAVPELLDHEAFVQPKFDGSNITCYMGTCLTRNLNPLPQNFREGLRTALGRRYENLMKLANKYQVFIELGGKKNSPAGYDEFWRADWDYRVFDLFAGKFLEPDKVMRILDKYELDYVGYVVMKVEDVVRDWHRLLKNNYRDFEGFVLKIYPDDSLLRKIKNHRQYNTVMAKFKHEYLGTVHVKVKKRKHKAKETEDGGKPPLPESEIMGAINKAHLILGDDIFDKKKAMPLIFKLMREEAEKHGCTAPSASKLYNYYMKYIEKIKGKQ